MRLWEAWGSSWGQKHKQRLTSLRSQDLKVINQTNKLINKVCSDLRPDKYTFPRYTWRLGQCLEVWAQCWKGQRGAR